MTRRQARMVPSNPKSERQAAFAVVQVNRVRLYLAAEGKGTPLIAASKTVTPDFQSYGTRIVMVEKRILGTVGISGEMATLGFIIDVDVFNGDRTAHRNLS